MFRSHEKYILKNWDLWRRERDVVGVNARLWEVCTPDALEMLMTVLRRVSGWSYELLLCEKQYYVSYFLPRAASLYQDWVPQAHRNLWLTSKDPYGTSTVSTCVVTTMTGSPAAMHFARQREGRRATLHGSGWVAEKSYGPGPVTCGRATLARRYGPCTSFTSMLFLPTCSNRCGRSSLSRL